MANFWLALCMALPVSASVYSVSRSDGFLREINPADGSTIAVLPMATGAPNLVPVLGANALTQNPITEQIYAAVTFQGNPGPVGNMGGTGGARTLVTLDIVTGSTPHVVVTRVAPLTQKVSSLTFDSTGQLYALSGSGSSTPNTLFRVSTTDGSLTHFFSFTVQNRGGEAIAFNSADGFLYHMAGVFPRVLEVVDLSIPAIVSSFNASIGGATTGMASDGLGGFFLAELFTDKFQIMTTTGVVTNRNTMDHEVTGLLGPLTVPCCVGDEAGFLSSYGTCESYLPGGQNHAFCDVDVNQNNGMRPGCTNGFVGDEPGCTDLNVGLFACEVCPGCAGSPCPRLGVSATCDPSPTCE